MCVITILIGCVCGVVRGKEVGEENKKKRKKKSDMFMQSHQQIL